MRYSHAGIFANVGPVPLETGSRQDIRNVHVSRKLSVIPVNVRIVLDNGHADGRICAHAIVVQWYIVYQGIRDADVPARVKPVPRQVRMHHHVTQCNTWITANLFPVPRSVHVFDDILDR